MAIRRTKAEFSDDIATADIADNSVTLAKMAGGTDGQIITYDASGDPIAIGPGTSGQVLVSAGAGAPPAFGTAFNADAAQVFNESGADVDFRIESDDNANMFFVDGGNDKIGIGLNTDIRSTLHIVAGTANNLAGSPPGAAYDDFLIEGTGDAGMAILSGTSNSSVIYFGDASESDKAHVKYDNQYDVMLLKAAGITKLMIGNTEGGTQNINALTQTRNAQSAICIPNQNGIHFEQVAHGDSRSWQIRTDHDSWGDLVFRSSGGANDNNPDTTKYQFRNSGSAYKPSGGDWSSLSDERIKTEITSLDTLECLNVVLAMKPKKFKFKNPDWHIDEPKDDDGFTYGFVAQDFEDIALMKQYVDNEACRDPNDEHQPEGVTECNPDCQYVDADRIIKGISIGGDKAFYVGAIQELSAKVATLEAIQEDSSSSNAALEARIIALENA